MADLRTSFITMEDASTQAGVPLHSALEGDAYAAKNAHGALIAKDGTNFAYLKLNPTTKAAYVDPSVPGVSKKARGVLAAGSGTTVLVTGAVITLTASKVYTNISGLVSSLRDSEFQLIWNDNGVETILLEAITGSGQYTVPFNFEIMEFTAGATGTQELKIKAKNYTALSALKATLVAKEIT